ncbi:major facilitator superfamily domain-containing protein 4A-like isoform X2 [Tachypleus tridentatus]|uniref:major facilitator superfamily domain-containing protein 4A-like isoform X2 n=1 Tax=Tachypleus tridentatus TaxID=6853 RepID=UPI003FCF934F
MERFTGEFPDGAGLPSPLGQASKSISDTEKETTTNFPPKEEGSAVDLANTLRGNLAFTHSVTLTKKERFYKLFWKNKHATVTLCCVFWSFGMCVAFLGPTLLDLGCKTSTVFSTMSWVFFSQSLFILLGSASGGFLLQRFTANLMLLVGTTMMTITMATIPLCNVLWMLAIVLAIMGFFMGTIDTVSNVSMIRIYGKEVSPFLQALHFFYGVGAFLSPMIAQPFLLNEDCSPFIDNTIQPVTESEENFTLPATTLAEAQRKTHIDFAFWILALLMVPVVILSLTLVGRKIHQRMFQVNSAEETAKKPSQYESMDSETSILEEKEVGTPATTFQMILVTLLCGGVLFLYDGLQAGYGGYIYSYGVKGPARLQRSEAAYLNALFWGVFAGGRLISIALATKLSPAFMLLNNIIGCTMGMILMTSFPSSQIALIFGTCLVGVFMSSVFPTALSLTEQYIHITPTITSVLVFGAAAGEMSMPVIIGHEFDRAGPFSFVVTGLVLCFLSVIVYVALWLAGHSIIRVSASTGLIGFLSSCIPRKGSAEREDSGLMRKHVRYYSRMRSELSESSLGDQYDDTTFTETDPTRDKR